MFILYTKRTDALLSALAPLGAEGAIIHNRSNMRWLSGYAGEGLLVIAPGLRAIVTDFRYTEQAERESPDYTVCQTEPTKLHPAIAAELVAKAGIQTIAFEDDVVTAKGAEVLKNAMPGVTFVSAAQKAQVLRQIKDEGEIALIEKACDISCAAFAELLGVIQPGMTELELRLELETRMYRLGADALAFDSIIASGENGALPHAVPSTRKIKSGDMITFDFGAALGGYCSDMTRTIALGNISDEQRRVYDTVLAAQLAALAAIAPGKSCKEIDAVARDMIDAAGYEGCFGHGLGHSLGLDIHENPRFSTLCEDVLAPNMVMTDEPGIYLRGRCGCRIEDTVLVTEDGVRRLTKAPKELIIL